MITFSKKYTCILFAAMLSAGMANLLISPVWAETTAEPQVKPDWAKMHAEHVKKRIDSLADRLEIKASQQAAWQAFAKALNEVFTLPAKGPEGKMDAASLARMHADRAAAHAQKLARLADATAKFQEVLTPDQRKTLDQIALHFEHRMHHFGHHHGNEHEEHGDGHWEHHHHGDTDDSKREH